MSSLRRIAFRIRRHVTALVLVIAATCAARLAPAQQPTAEPPCFGFVGLHGGVFAQLQQFAAALPVRVVYLTDEQLAQGEADVARCRLIFVQHVRADAGPALADAVQAARANGRDLRVFALSGGSGGSARPRQLSDKAEQQDLLERDPNVQAYYGSSPENLRRLLVYALATYCGADLQVEPALPVAGVGVFHPDLGQIVDLPAFEQFLQQRGGDWANRPRVAVVAHDMHLQLQQPAVVEALVRGLERQGLCACAVLDTGEGLRHMLPRYVALLEGLHIDAVVHTCHSTDTVELRERLDVPHLHSIFFRRQSIAEWHADPQGLDAHEIAFQVATQETLGAIEPQIGSGTEHGGGSEEAMTPIPERIEHLVRRTASWVTLRRLQNADKRVAVLYWDKGMDKRGLGRGTATGQFLNVPQSLVVLLDRLQREGYAVRGAPKGEDELVAAMLRSGRQLLPDDTAGMAALVRDGRPALVPVARFLEWVQKRVPAAARARIEERWGPAPGRFMVWRDDRGESFFVVPHLDYGGVILLPQAARGEANDSAAIHDAFTAPPWNYLATYFWLQEGWGAHAMVHFGTHGSDIALPGKATGLCDEDWCDIVMGDLPNVYPWIVENLGEAPAAKRRSYGVLIGHLPPPVVGAGLDDGLKRLHEDLEKWMGLQDGALKERFRAQVSEQARALQLDRDLGAAFPPDGPLEPAVLQQLDDRLHALLEEPINTSLHRLGEVPPDDVLVPHLVTCLHRAFLERLAPLFPAAADDHAEQLHDAAEQLVRLVAIEGKEPAAALRETGARVPEAGVPERLLEDLQTASRMYQGYQQTDDELKGLLAALAGRFVRPGPGCGPDRNPAVLPTGRNLYLLNQDEVPSKASWELGRDLADSLLADYREQHGRLPEKVAFTLSAHATFQDFGVMESQILRLLGVEPIWNERGLVKDVRVLPREELGRPRVDVLINSGGRYYASLPSRMDLLDAVLRRIQEVDEPDNGVRNGSAAMLAELRRRGLPSDQARTIAAARIFGRGPGYEGMSSKFADLVDRSNDWDTREDLLDFYLDRMGHAFVHGDFVEVPRAGFETALRGTDVVLRTWYRSTSSPLTNRYDWLIGGALAAAVEQVTGKRPEFRLVDVRDPDRAANVDAGLAVRRDFRARLFNRKWIEGMQQEGYAGADQVAVLVGNAFGWEAMRAGTVTDALWNEVKQVYLDDSLQLGTKEWFDRENPWARQSVASVLLDAARKGFWRADAATLAEVAATYLESVREHGSGGGLRDAGRGAIRAYAESLTAKSAGAAPADAAAPVPSVSTPASPPVSAAPRSPAPAPETVPATETVTGERLEAARETAPAAVANDAPAPAWTAIALGGAALLFLLGFALRRAPV